MVVVWEPYWHLRGKRGHQYCMARFGDEGAYEPGNVEIITNSENARLRKRPARSAPTQKLPARPAPKAPAKRKAPELPGGKFDDKCLLRMELPTPEQRQFYLSEKLERGLSLRMAIGFGGRKRWSAATYDALGKTVQTPLDTFPETRCREARVKAYSTLED